MRRTMRNTVILAVCALAGISTLASAQRRGGGGGGGRGMQQSAPDRADAEAMGPHPVPPTVASLVLDHASDLSLADSQRVLIEAVRQTQDSANRPWMHKLDSLRPTGRPANGPNDLSQEQRDAIEARRAAVAEVLNGMRETNAIARQKVMAALTPDQQKKAAEYEEEARKKADEQAKRQNRASGDGDQRRGGRGGGMGGGMGGGRPPED